MGHYALYARSQRQCADRRKAFRPIRQKKLFLIEVGLFGLGSLLVALSQSFPLFLISRLIQALGGGGIFIIGSSHVLATLPKEKQGKALGLLGAMNGMAAVLGPNIGSFLLDWTGSWHWLFLINLPIAVLLVVFGVFFIVETKAPEAKRLDTAGIFLLSLSILAVMYGMTNLDGTNLLKSLGDPEVYGFILIGIFCFAALVWFEKRMEMRGAIPFWRILYFGITCFSERLSSVYYPGACWRRLFLFRHMLSNI